MGAAEAAAAIHAGISAAAVEVLDAVPVEKWKWLVTIGIDKSTLARRIATRKPLDPAQAEGVLRAMELAVLATEVFGTTDRAAGWLGSSHPLLGGMSPLEYANSAYGLAQVKSILTSIRFGGVV